MFALRARYKLGSDSSIAYRIFAMTFEVLAEV